MSNFLQADIVNVLRNKVSTAVATEPADTSALKTLLDAIYNDPDLKGSIVGQILKNYADNTVTYGGKLNGSVTITNGGTGYSVGDIMPVTGSISGENGSVIVTSVNSGVIDGCEINNAGNKYVGTLTIDTSGKGNSDAVLAMASPATYEEQTIISDYINIAENAGKAKTVAVNAGGTGYAVDDVLSVTTASGTGLTVKVTSVSAGVVTGLSIVTPGSGMTSDTNSGAVTGGTGTGCTVDVTAYII